MDSPVPRKEPSVWTADALMKGFQWYLDGNCTGDPSTRICFLALGAFAGLRPSEIEGVAGERNGLNWQDIDFQRRHIHIRPEVAGKLAEPRYIAFTGKPESGLSDELARISHTASAATCCGPPPLRSGPNIPRTVCSHTARREIRSAPHGDSSSPRLATKQYEKSGLADKIWKTLASWLIPRRKASGPVAGRKTQRDMSVELREAKVIEHWPKDALRHTWISSMLALSGYNLYRSLHNQRIIRALPEVISQ